MDLHCNASHAPVRDAEHRSYNASDPLPGSDAWIAERQNEEQTLNALEAQITELWGNINAATAHFLALLAEFDRREGWAQHGVANCAHWLSWQCGIGAVAARPMHGDVSAETSRAQSARWHHLCRAPENVSAETPTRSVSQRRADALEHILGRFLAGKCSAASAHEVVVHIAHDALRDVPESSGAEFDNGRSVAVETARRLGCDGALVGVVEGAKGEPLAVGRRTRAVPPAIRRALRVRDGGCRFPGCDRSRFTHAHHIKHWADGGETALHNLVTLCSFHHRQVHEGGFGVRMNEGEIEFTQPDGRVIPPAGKAQEDCFRGNNCVASGTEQLKAFNAKRGLNIDAQTACCKWGGERMDYNIAIDGLCWKAGYT